jgi:cytochrome d ubiquinol oxidase subunit I
VVDPATRLQSALTTVVHIVFPVVTMGLGPCLVSFTRRAIRTERVIDEQLRRFWTRIVAVRFVVGTVTGLVLEFEFGTNVAAFSRTAGELLGGPLALEGLVAFMLDAAFLGIFVSGRDRISDAREVLSAVAVLLYNVNARVERKVTGGGGPPTGGVRPR